MAVVDIVTGEVIDPKEYRGVWYSASLLEDMAQCPAKAYGRITKQKQMNPGLALINGIAVHYGMERWLKDRKDPIKTYNDTYKLEAEKQGVNWKSDEAEEKRREGEKMLAATWAQYKDPRFLERVDPKLVEPKFRVMRDGRMFVGKLDLLFFKEPGRYNYVDFKSSKNPPSQWELDNDIQFNLYPWASFYSDELPTNESGPSTASGSTCAARISPRAMTARLSASRTVRSGATTPAASGSSTSARRRRSRASIKSSKTLSTHCAPISRTAGGAATAPRIATTARSSTR